jgi:hypothetical protein
MLLRPDQAERGAVIQVASCSELNSGNMELTGFAASTSFALQVQVCVERGEDREIPDGDCREFSHWRGL